MGWRETAGIKPKAPAAGWRKTAGMVQDDPLPEQPPPTTLQSAASGAVQGASLGFGDEIAGALDTIPEATNRLGQALGLTDKPKADIEGHLDQESADASADKQRGSLIDYYRQMRDQHRAENKTAEDAHSTAYGGGELAGAMAVPIPGGAGKTLLGKVAVGTAKGAGYGTAVGLGKSEADLTKGDVKGAALDSAKSGAFGAAGGAVGGVADYGLGKLGEAFAGNAAKATQKAKDMAEAKAEKLMNSALGTLGGQSSAGRNAIEVMHEIVQNPDSTAQQIAAAKSLLDDQGSQELIQRVYKNAISDFPRRLDRIKLAEKGVQEAADANTPAALAAAKDEILSNPISKQFLPRVKRQVLNRAALPILGGAAGAATASALDLDPVHGAELGGALGVGANSLIGGHAGTAWEKMMAHPAVQKGLNETLQRATVLASPLAQKAGAAVGSEVGAPEHQQIPIEDPDGSTFQLSAPRSSVHPRDSHIIGRPASPAPHRARSSVTVEPLEPRGLTRVPESSVDVKALPPTSMVVSNPSTPEEIARDEEIRRRDRAMRIARFFSNNREDNLDDLDVQR